MLSHFVPCIVVFFLSFFSEPSLSIRPGYFSTTARLKDNPTELQRALAQVSSLESLEVLEKLSYNVCVMPTEEKYRKIKLTNPKIKRSVADVPEALAVLIEQLGWEKSKDDADESVLVLPRKVCMTMNQVRDIQTAQHELKSKERDLKRHASAGSLQSKQLLSKKTCRDEAKTEETTISSPVAAKS